MTEVREAEPVRTAVTGVALALPLAGLALLLWQPELDLAWEHHPTHFWLVLGTAAVSALLAYAMGVAALRRGDARVLFVSLTFLSSAGFLGLHALATPGVLLDEPNPGFVVATPVGLALGSVLAAWSTVDLTGERAVRAVRVGRWVLRRAARAHGPVGGALDRAPPAARRLRRGRRVACRRCWPCRRCCSTGTPPPATSPLWRRQGVDDARRRDGRVPAAGRVPRRHRLRPQLAPVVVGVARADAGGVRPRRRRRPPVLARGTLRRPLPARHRGRQPRRSACSSRTCRASRRTPRRTGPRR